MHLQTLMCSGSTTKKSKYYFYKKLIEVIKLLKYFIKLKVQKLFLHQNIFMLKIFFSNFNLTNRGKLQNWRDLIL